MNEIILRSIKDQLDRIELHLMSSSHGGSAMSESGAALAFGGTDALRELNKKRAAEQRRKKR